MSIDDDSDEIMTIGYECKLLEITAFALMVVKWCSCRTRIGTVVGSLSKKDYMGFITESLCVNILTN